MAWPPRILFEVRNAFSGCLTRGIGTRLEFYASQVAFVCSSISIELVALFLLLSLGLSFYTECREKTLFMRCFYYCSPSCNTLIAQIYFSHSKAGSSAADIELALGLPSTFHPHLRSPVGAAAPPEVYEATGEVVGSGLLSTVTKQISRAATLWTRTDLAERQKIDRICCKRCCCTET